MKKTIELVKEEDLRPGRGGKREGAGRKPRVVTELRKKLLQCITLKEKKELIKKAFQTALDGDKDLQKYFIDQIIGRSAQPIEHSGEIKQGVNYSDEIERIKKRANELSELEISGEGISDKNVQEE